jgi:hypothetical protein
MILFIQQLTAFFKYLGLFHFKPLFMLATQRCFLRKDFFLFLLNLLTFAIEVDAALTTVHFLYLFLLNSYLLNLKFSLADSPFEIFVLILSFTFCTPSS